MPVYEYQTKPGYEGCKYCKGRFEITQKITDGLLKKCPKCESPLEKIISKSSFQIHGYSEKNGYSGTPSNRK